MKIRLLACLCIAMFPPLCGASDFQLGNNTVIHFASKNEGRKVLTTKDEFVQHLSPFDRSARMKVARAVTEEEYLSFAGENAADWTTEETQQIETSLSEIKTRFRDLAALFPSTIQLIKTSGVEEGNASYTRGSAIMIPKAELEKKPSDLTRVVCHELFHILSRHNAALRDELYGLIGFAPCDDLQFPPQLASRKITNPDAPRNDHFIRLEIDGQKCLAIPVLFSRTETYDNARGGEFFEYLQFQFLVVRERAGSNRLEVVYENSAPRLVSPRAVTGFFEQVGGNTDYIIHPEEILADNFALLVLGNGDVHSPEILEKMKTVLAHKNKG